jgi:type IV pilus assembly protein PilM
MSSSKRLIINCGASRVTAAVISSHGGSLQIDKLVSEDLQYDFSNEDAILPSVGEALKTLAQTHKLSGKATLIVPGNQILTKTIRIPHIEEAKRAQIIAFEAQQNIPYPLHEVVWDSQVVGDDGVETEVLFIAAKSNVVDEFCGYVADAGFAADNISAATVLDYNTLQFAYPEMDEDVLLINIGARSTNLLFRNPDGFFVRNIQLGGNSLTQNIADSLGKPFPQAEVVKHKFFAEDNGYSEDDSGAKLLTSCAESFMRRMSQEITRSIVNYRRQKGGAAPKRILLNGRGSLLKGLAEQLSTTQKVKVEYFDPLKNVTLDGSIDMDIEVLRLQTSEIIGEACRGMIPNAAGVNLLPEGVQADMAFAKKKPFILLAAACLALAPFPALVAYMNANTVYREEVQSIQSGLQPLQNHQSEIMRYKEAAVRTGAAIQRVEGLVNSKSNWIQFFAELQGSLHMAEDVWLDKLNVVREQTVDGKSSYEVVVEGQLLVRESANGAEHVDEDALSDQLKGLRASFEDSAFIVSSHSPVVTWTNLHKGLNVLPFSINLVVDATKPL